MTKQFLITAEIPNGVNFTQGDDYLRNELEQFAGALLEFHAHGVAPAVKCILVNPLPHVVADLEAAR